MGIQRVRQSTAATLQVTTTDQYGAGEDRSGAVLVTVTRADGTELVSATSATSAGAGVYTLSLTAADTALLDVLTATWTDVADGVDWYTYHRIVGGFLFTIGEARAYDDVLNDSAKYPDTRLAATRAEVEDEAEWICDRSFVPAYAWLLADGNGTPTITVPLHDLRRVRSCSILETADGPTTTLSAVELAALALPANTSSVTRTDGNVFPFGRNNVRLGIEYGLPGPDEMMVRAAITRCRSRLNAPKTGLPERTRSHTDAAGNTYQFTGPDAFRTGVDSVDAVYLRYSKRVQHDPSAALGGAGGSSLGTTPASGTLSYDPQWRGLFRGGPR